MKEFGFLLVLLAMASPGGTAEKVKSVTVAVENPTDMARPAADVVMAIADLRKIAPDFQAGSLRVVCDPAEGPKESQELPSQVDDLDGDGKADELAFQIDLGPRQSRTVTIQYGEPDQIFRLRRDYRERTYALFSTKYEGLGWESENIAFRIYFDPRNAIDIYGKRRRSLQLRMYAVPEYPYHDESPDGRDIFKVGESTGIGAMAAWVDGKVVRAAEVKERTWRIISLGPVRTIVELEYRGWNLGSKTITARSRISMWAGEHGFYHSVAVDPQESTSVVTGFPVMQNVSLMESSPAAEGSATWMATWGEQVLAPGATATQELSGQYLGLAIVARNPSVEFVEDKVNYLVRFAPQKQEVSWYALAAWDQEEANGNDSSGVIRNRNEFLKLVKEQARTVAEPVKVHVIGINAH